MKTSMLLLIAAAAAVSQTPIAKCRDVNGRPCTAKQVDTLSSAVFAGKQQHDALALFRQLTLASADGTLKCTQNDGSACTSAQLDIVKEIAANQQLYVNYKSTAPKK